MQNTTSRILSLLLALVMVLSMVPTVFAAEDSVSVTYVAENTTTGVQYESINDAIAAAQAGQIVKALADAENVTYGNEGVILDLNGHDLSLTVAEGVTLSAIDSATDDYEGAYGSLTTDGTVATTVKTTGEVKSYVTIAENGSYTFHRYYAAIAAISLKPTQVSLGYRAEFRGDEAVKNAVTGYGYEMWLNGGAHKVFTQKDALEKSSLTLRLKNILSEGSNALNALGSTATIGGNAFITLNLGGEEVKLYGTEQETTLRQVVESVNANVSSYGEAQLQTVRDMCTTYAAWMEGWETDAIFGKGEGEGDDTGLKVEITVDVTAENGVLTQDATLSSDDITVTVPQGTTLEDGVTQLVLTITEKASSDSDITAEEDETLIPLDVHIEGISESNTTPILVCLGEILPKGLNIGNYALYHVENGETVEMTHVLTLDELDTHNEFHYDPATGAVTVAVCSFSEITLTSKAAKWVGGVDHSWYTANPNADQNTYCIYNADQLNSFAQIVGGMVDGIAQDSFSGKTVILHADLDLDDLDSENGRVFYPIGYWNNTGSFEHISGGSVSSGFYSFDGTFDGNGHTISNFYQNTWEMFGDYNDGYSGTPNYYRDGMGLFGKVYGGTVKNLTVKDFSSDGEFTTTGTIAAYADCGAKFENISIFDCNPRVYNIGNGGIVGCVGWYAKEAVNTPVTFTNITVDNSNKISALWGSWDVACGGLVGQYYPTSGQSSANYPANAGIHMENCHVAAQIDVNNDVCANYQYYAYRYAGMLIGSVRENVTAENGRVYPKMDGITANNCTVHYGTWNDYYYCELVANSIASYTHDYQFSRLTQVADVKVDTLKYLPLDATEYLDIPEGTVNYVVVNGNHATANATCFHFVDRQLHSHDDIDGDGVHDKQTVNNEEIYIENNRHIYLPFDQLVTGYGWGVTSKGLGEMDGVIILDRLNANSVSKFDVASPKDKYLTDETVTIGDLFKENTANTAIVPINKNNVKVFVSPVGDNSTAGGKYEPNTSDWTKGKLTFTGSGDAQIIITDYYYCTIATIDTTVSGGYTISYFVPEGVDAIAPVEGTKVTLPTPTGTPKGDYTYTFLGWTTEIIPDTIEKPVTIYTAGNEYIAAKDTILYALYEYHTDSYEHTEYVLSDISNIQATDEVVITMTYMNGLVYTLSSTNGTTKAPAANTIKVDTENHILEEEPAESIIWNISNDNGNLTIYVNGSTSKWLYCTDINDGVRVGSTSDSKIFTIDADSGYLKNTATSRYVGVYRNNPDWRCYENTTGNTANQTLGFYVKVTDFTFEGEEGTYYTTGICKHTETHVESLDPTCTTEGYVKTVCDKCGGTTHIETIDPLGHNWDGGSCSVCGAARPAGWVLVTDASSLAVGDQIVIVSNNDVYAMGEQKDNNRDAVQVTVDRINKTIVYVDGVQILTLAEGDVDGTYAFDTGDGYLYAASSSANHLKTEASLSGNSSWSIDITDGIASVVAQGSNSRSTMLFNFSVGNTLFSCYAGSNSITNGEISLYRLQGAGEGACQHETVNTVEKLPTCTEDGYRANVCVVCGHILETFEVYAAKGHTEASYEEKAATCTEPGKTGGKYCTVCRVDLEPQTTVPALGHNWQADGTCANGCGEIKNVYTVTYSVPNAVTALEADTVLDGNSVTLPTAGAPEGYTFAGWATEEIDNATSDNGVMTGAYTPEKDITLYAVYSYTEAGSGSSTYSKYSGTITEGDYVIVYNEYAMENTVSSSRLTYSTDFTVTNGVIQNPDASIVWHIAPDGSNWTIYNEEVGKYAAGTGANNKAQLLATISDYARWTVSGTNTYEFVNIGNTGNKNLRNNGTYGFACYSTSTGGALTLYKATNTIYYTTNPEVLCVHSNTTETTVEATCTTAGSTTVTCDDCGETISTTEIPATGEHTYVDGACSVCGATEASEITTTYTFSSFAAGTQYAQGEEHELDENVNLTINGAHLNTQVRLYAGSNAILEALSKVITSITVKAGYKAGTLNVYASSDGETWTLVAAQATTTSYTEYTFALPEGTTHVKLESVGAQIRVSEATLTME